MRRGAAKEPTLNADAEMLQRAAAMPMSAAAFYADDTFTMPPFDERHAYAAGHAIVAACRFVTALLYVC